MKKKQKLTGKQKAFIKAKIKNPTISNRKAMREAGYSEQTILSGKVMKGCIGTLKEELIKIGLTEDYLSLKLKEGTDAYREMIVKKGRKMAIRKSTDFLARVKYLELITKLRGDIKDNPEIIIPNNLLAEEIKKLREAHVKAINSDKPMDI